MINERHQFHVVARAQVVSVALELSCDEIILKPTPSMAAESGRSMFPGDLKWREKTGTSC